MRVRLYGRALVGDEGRNDDTRARTNGSGNKVRLPPKIDYSLTLSRNRHRTCVGTVQQPVLEYTYLAE